MKHKCWVGCGWYPRGYVVSHQSNWVWAMGVDKIKYRSGIIIYQNVSTICSQVQKLKLFVWITLTIMILTIFIH